MLRIDVSGRRGGLQGGWGELDGVRLGKGRAGRCRWLVERVGLSDVAWIVGALVLVDCGSGRRSAECAVRLVCVGGSGLQWCRLVSYVV